MSQDDFFSGISSPRNKELMRVFRDVEMVEALGSGMRRILDVYDRSNFVFLDNFIRVAIPFAWLPSEKTSEKTSEKIIKLVLSNPYISISELAQEINISTRNIERNIQKLRDSNRIRRVGPDKGGHWEVLQP